MKLYTEEQAKYFFECGRNYQNNAEITFQVAKEEMPTAPIELPSDEEIEEESPYVPSDASLDFWAHKEGFIDGAKWMRDKIQGGNK